jgi:hypothetical protein
MCFVWCGVLWLVQSSRSLHGTVWEGTMNLKSYCIGFLGHQYFVLMVIIIIITISFMQGIYTYIHETNNVPKKYNVAAILSLLFMVPISLVPALTLMYFYMSYCYYLSVFSGKLCAWIVDVKLTDIWTQNYIFHIPYGLFVFTVHTKIFYERISCASLSIYHSLTSVRMFYTLIRYQRIKDVRTEVTLQFCTSKPIILTNSAPPHPPSLFPSPNHIIRLAAVAQTPQIRRTPE